MSKIKLQTYNQSQHGISIDQIIPSARVITTRLIENGFQAYIVGGAVRDLLLGMHPKDFDIATNATPEEIKYLFKRDCRIIGRRFRLAHVYHNREMYEVATFRGHTAQDQRVVKQGHIVSDNTFGTIEQDAIRRDFTCNALYFDIENANILDYCNGVEDIKNAKLEFIGDDTKRIIEDPIRMIRAIRFQTKLDLRLSIETRQAVIKQHKTLANVSMARLFDELIKLFHSGYAFKSFDLMQELLLFQYIFPQVSKSLNSNNENIEFIHNALRSTDKRIALNKSVTPIFLFACFLWPIIVRKVNHYTANGTNHYDAVNNAANEVFQLTRQKLVIPKMIQAGMRHIWILQNRFQRTRGKKVYYTLEHHRFRAAYDFLLLRHGESEEVKRLGEWWTHIQTLSDSEQKEIIFSKQKSKSAEGKVCYLALGSNIGDTQENIKAAIQHISELHNVKLMKVARLYLTKAWGKTDQDDFVNTVIKVSTTLKPKTLLTKVQEIETEMGRVEAEKWGPRLIDIDILLYSNNVVNQPHLTIPHPHMTKRSFVLAPLNEISPNLVIPKAGNISKYIDKKEQDKEIIAII